MIRSDSGSDGRRKEVLETMEDRLDGTVDPGPRKTMVRVFLGEDEQAGFSAWIPIILETARRIAPAVPRADEALRGAGWLGRKILAQDVIGQEEDT